jgi:hypothetical protein
MGSNISNPISLYPPDPQLDFERIAALLSAFETEPTSPASSMRQIQPGAQLLPGKAASC